MALLNGCENGDDNLCSIQQNWTWRHYNICSEVEVKAQLEFSDSDSICNFVKLAMFLVHFCSQFPKWNLDYMICLQQFGIAARMCSSIFPDLSSKPFLHCFNTVTEIVGERTNKSDTEWFHHIQNAVCFDERTSNTGLCVDDDVMQLSVFDVTWFAPNETVIMIYSYVFPAVAVFVIFINIILLIVMLQIISNDAIKLLLCTISMCEVLIVITLCSVYLGFFTTGRYHDYIPYAWCVIIMLILDILTPLFHAVSIWLTLGMAIQRYLVIKFPFTARTYGGKKARNLVLLYIAMTSIITSISHVPPIICITKMTPLPLMSKTDITNEVVTAAVKYDETFHNLRVIGYTIYGIVNKTIPIFLMIIFEIALLMALHKQRKQHKEVTNQPLGNEKLRLVNVLTSIIVMTVLVAEIPSVIVIFLAISGYSLDSKDATAFLNFLPLVLYPANLVICCCIAKDFRDKLFESVRKCMKC